MTEESFVRELERRADHAFDGTHGTSITFEAVRSKAHGIRRRRRAAAAGAVAAAVAVAILVPTALGGGSDRSQGPEPAPQPSTASGASVLHGGALTLPDGTAVWLDVDDLDRQAVGVLTDGRIAVVLNQPNRLRVFAPDGTPAAQLPIGDTLIRMSPDDDAVAWMAGDGSVMVLSSGVPDPVELGTVELQAPASVSIDAVVDAEHVLVGDGHTTTMEVTPEGVRPLTTSEPLRITDVSPDGNLWAVRYDDESDPQFGCVGLYDPHAGQMVARNCDTALLMFAPDGQHLTGALGDGGTWASVEVFDLDLSQVASFVPTDGQVIKDWAWAGDDRLFATTVAFDPGRNQLLQVPISDPSSAETIGSPVMAENAETVTEFLLSE